MQNIISCKCDDASKHLCQLRVKQIRTKNYLGWPYNSLKENWNWCIFEESDLKLYFSLFQINIDNFYNLVEQNFLQWKIRITSQIDGVQKGLHSYTQVRSINLTQRYIYNMYMSDNWSAVHKEKRKMILQQGTWRIVRVLKYLKYIDDIWNIWISCRSSILPITSYLRSMRASRKWNNLWVVYTLH